MKTSIAGNNLKKYCEKALLLGFTRAKPSVVTAPWVRLKCRFGCPGYGQSYCCPPNTPTPEETRRILDCYRSAILLQFEVPDSPDCKKLFRKAMKALVDVEGEIFKDGYYKAFAFISGPCSLCRECASISGNPCVFGYRARPSMESCGVDVFQTARGNGLSIRTLKNRTDTQNKYCLMLVD